MKGMDKMITFSICP